MVLVPRFCNNLARVVWSQKINLFKNVAWYLASRRRHINIYLILPSVQCTKERFVSFLSGGFTTMAVINPPERKLAKPISVEWFDVCPNSEGSIRISWCWIYLLCAPFAAPPPQCWICIFCGLKVLQNWTNKKQSINVEYQLCLLQDFVSLEMSV